MFEVLRNEWLAHARHVLLAEQASLKDVAFRVGYDHVSNFITAFTARRRGNTWVRGEGLSRVEGSGATRAPSELLAGAHRV